MKLFVQIIVLAFVALILFGILGLMMGNGSGDSYCKDTTQHISDQKWYELCKDDE